MNYIVKTALLSTVVLTQCLTQVQAEDTWGIADSIALDAVVVDVIKDPNRNYLYALDRIDSKVIFIDLDSKLINKIYVGKLPTSIIINDAGDKLYVANRGNNAGTSGDYQIAVIDIATQTKSHHFLTSYQPGILAMGSDQRLYYTDGSWERESVNSHGPSGGTGIIDLTTETEIGNLGYTIKSRIVINNDRTKLYGQYVYTGNLGEMGVFDVENVTSFQLDRCRYSPYPYGWDYNNYCISSNGNRLAYGRVLFNADNLIIQYGVFTELIYALNGDGSIAFGNNSIWGTSTFSTSGNATNLLSHNLSSSVMCFDSQNNCLYAFTPTDYSIKKLGKEGVLTVNGGSGSGTYKFKSSVPIIANVPEAGMRFDRWAGATNCVADVLAENTTVTIPIYSITLIATYKPVYYPLTVLGGTGGGSYTNGQTVAITATVPSGWVFEQWNDGDLNASRTITMSTNDLVYTAAFRDITLPVLTVSFPTNNVRITNVNVTVTGIATDNSGQTDVLVQLNGGVWQVTNALISTTNWVANLMMQPGTNIIQSYARDAAGNCSSTSTLTLTCVVFGNLTIHTNGAGTVSLTQTNLLEVSKTYTLMATPKTGFGFSGWTGDLTSTNNVVTFIMASNTTIVANFSESVKPTVKITAPTASQKIFGATGDFTVRGTALDNLALSNVMVRVNGGSFVPASTTTNGWKNWSLPVTLILGTNTITAYSMDTTGNSSIPVTTKCVYTETGTLTIITNGPGKVTISPTGPLLLNKIYTLTAAVGRGAVFSNWTGDVVIGNPTSKVVKVTLDPTNRTKTVTANFTDIQKPTVKITAPTASLRILGTNGLFTVRGTATDNLALSNVLVQLNGGSWVDATTTNNWKNWSLPVMLAEKTNTIRACSLDTTGNYSLTSTVMCIYVPTARLMIQTNGPGTVTRSPIGEPEVGKTYTLTATPKVGSVFSNWAGDTVSNPTSKVVTINMTSNKTVMANFIDIQKPTVAITAPTALLRVTNAAYTVRGTTTDNGAVAIVKVQLNNDPWTNAVTTNSWKSWSVPVTLIGGTNIIQAYSVDTANNCSSTASVKCVYLEPITLVDYYPLPLGAEWLYSGTDWDGYPNKLRNRITSTNYVITTYTGRSPVKSYTTNCVRMFAEYLDSDTMVAYDNWDEYWVGGGRFGTFGDDDLPDESIRVDGGWILPAQMVLGSSATKTVNVYDGGVFQGSTSCKLQMIEKTSITVPAGTFQDVLHVRITFGPQVFDEWWARSVGMVKKKGISGNGAAQDYELTQYSLPPGSGKASTEIAKPAAAKPAPADASTIAKQTVAPVPTAQATITVDGLVKDWANVPCSSFSYASVTQEVAVALDGNNIALLLKGCPFGTSDTVLVYFKLRLSYGIGDNRHSVDLWTSGSVLYGMVDGQVIAGLEAVLLNGVLEVKLPVEQAPSQVTIEEIGCGMDLGGGTLTELFKAAPAVQ